MEIPGNKNGVDIHSIQEKVREAQEKSGPQKVRGKASVGRSSSAGGVGKQAGGADEVHISGRARDVQKARAEIDIWPEIRADKVQEIKAAISEGKYYVDAKDIADKILREHFSDIFG